MTLSTDVNGVPFNQGPITFFAEPRDSAASTRSTTWTSGSASSSAWGSKQIEVIFDVFNVFNTSAVTNVNINTGSDFQNADQHPGPAGVPPRRALHLLAAVVGPGVWSRT